MDTATEIITTFTWGEYRYNEKGECVNPEYIARNAFLNEVHGNTTHHLYGNVDTMTVIMRRMLINSASIYGTEKGYNSIGSQFTTDLRWVVLDTSTDKVLTSDRYKFDTQKEAEAAMRKWKKNIIASRAEAAALAELKDITMPTAFFSPVKVKALPTPNPFTKVGDLVQVRGFGKQRAGYVVEASPVRVKCIIRTVESTKRQNDGDHGYCKWFKRGA